MDVHHLKFTLGKDIASESIIVKDETQETERGKDNIFQNIDVSLVYQNEPRWSERSKKYNG